MPGHQQLTFYDAILLTVDLSQQTLSIRPVAEAPV